MARVNIEDCWWTDPRRSLLLQMGVDADGLAARAWKLAQDFWKNDRGLVPLKLFDALQGGDKLIQVGLAEVRGDMVYVCGSSAYLDWVFEKIIQAKEAGKKSAEVRRAKHGSAQPKARTNPERTPNEPRTESNDAEPSVSDSFSGSISDSFSDSLFSKEREEPKIKSAPPNAGAFIAAYCVVWKRRYGSRPEILGKEQGIAKRLLGGMTVDRACKLVEAFLQMNNAWFVQKRHDLATFEQNLNAVVQFLDTGGNVTDSQIRQAEKISNAESQLKRIASGEL